jgi:hypothetical protein
MYANARHAVKRLELLHLSLGQRNGLSAVWSIGMMSGWMNT